MQGNQLKQSDKHKIMEFFTDKKIGRLLHKQLQKLYETEYNQHYIYTIMIYGNHFYLYIQGAINNNNNNYTGQNASSYCIKITKGFPLEKSVRVYLLKHNIHPKITDGRDLVVQILGVPWSHKKTLLDILKGIPNFEKRLESRNQMYLALQKTGQFQIGDTFTRNELTNFESLDVYSDISNQQLGPLVCVSQTHLIILKPMKSKSIEREYQLHRACDLQCISSIRYEQSTHQVIMTVTKYMKGRNFNEYAQLNKKYVIHNADSLILKILNHISKFQKCQMNLNTSSQWHQQKDFNDIYTLIKSSELLNEKLEDARDSGIQQLFQQLNKNYQKIIQYFSSRGDSYHLIYVNKLNNLCSLRKN